MELQAAAVGLGDRRDDREAQPGAGIRSGPLSSESPERFASSRAASSVMAGPPFSTMRLAESSSVVVRTRIQPPRSLWRTALSITLSTMRVSNVSLPVTIASGQSSWWTSRAMRAIAAALSSSAEAPSASSGTVISSFASPRWARGEERKFSSSWSMWSSSPWSRPASAAS